MMAVLLTFGIATAQTFTFTNCGQTGYTGPSQSQINSEYGSSNTLYTQVTSTSGIQYWTVPAAGTYSIQVHGAEGGQSNNYGGSGSGGDGAMMSGKFTLQAGTQLKILVGQQGTANQYEGGGGGGTFVTLTDNTPLIIAGGGGGAANNSCSQTYQHGWVNNNGQTNCNGTSGGTNGSGGNNCTTAGGGGGLLTNGSGSWPGTAFVNGGNGHSSSADGGFGCGGSGGGTSGAGGGGGYSGGAGSCWSEYAGGGGSYNSGTNQVNQTGENTGHGYVVIYAPPCAYSTTNVSLAIGTTSYAWNGTTYTAGGTYIDTLSAAAGCDSVAILNLTIPTGTGILAHCNAVYDFTPTTVDSTSEYYLVLTNTVGVNQTVNLTGLSAPFVMNSSITLPANGSDSVQIAFNPTATGSFADTLSWSGSVYGSGSIIFNGEGVQVSIGVGSGTLTLDTVALGNSVSDDIWLFNTGTGTMVVSDITSDDSTVTISPTTFNVAEGDSTTINVSYTPLFAGNMSAVLTIYSNDPNNPTTTIDVYGNAISEVSDTLDCNSTWLLVNSPYSFTSDVYLTSGCNLTIEPGVVVSGNGYSFFSNGTVNAVGTQTDSIYLNNMAEIEFMNNTSSDNLKYININQAGPTLYIDDFESGQYQTNWNQTTNFSRSTSYGSPYGSPGEGVYMYSDDGTDLEYITGPFTANSEYLSFSFDYTDYENETDCSVEFYYRINSGSWKLLLMDETQTISWVTETVAANEMVTIGDQIEFKVLCNTYNSGTSQDDLSIWFDNFKVNNSKINLRQENNLNLTNSTITTGEIYTEYLEHLDITDFEGSTSLPTGWTYTEDNSTPSYSISTSYGNPGNGIYFAGYDYDSRIISPTYVCNGIFNVSYDYRKYSTFENYCYARFYYQINGGSWVMFAEHDYQSSTNWETYSHSIPATTGDNVKLKFESDVASTSNSQDEARFNLDNITVEHSLPYGSNSNISFNNCVINSGLNLERDLDIDSSTVSCGMLGLHNTKSVTFNNSTFSGNNGISTNGSAASISMYNSTVQNSSVDGIKTTGSSSPVSLQYSFVKDNGGIGILTTGSGSHVTLSSSMVTANGSYGIESSGQVNSNYSNITFNEDDGVFLTGNNFSNIKNSIIWGNDIVNYNQINTSSGVTSITYSTVQGSGAYGTTGGQYYYGDGSIDDDPVFANGEQHMSTFSNCVDAGTPWEVDANMPYGLGGVRADIGIYGGPDNWFWGGTPVPDGAPVLTSIEDSPQDQGGIAGLLFDASVWDNSTLVNNVTHYSFWRNYDITGGSIDSVDQGNWQMMGSMQAQSFNGYAYEAATLGDSNLVSGMFNNCYVVVAHTGDSSTYWYSNVLCGYSTDDLAPSAPVVSAMAAPNTPDDVIVYWDAPTVADYAYSEVYSMVGTTNLGTTTDTLMYDYATLSGGTYTYAVRHFDVNGNPSDTSWVTITLDDNEDVIPLTAGWNLISTNKLPSTNVMQQNFASLLPGNLVYVTAFNQGSSLYNPNGLPFLNTLNQFTDGYGYWVKVLADDTLRVIGQSISPAYKIDLMPGWNLSGYMNPQAAAPSTYLGNLIDVNNLEYCTGFAQGTQVFNPNGLPFLNTLTSMQRPYGYWIKVSTAVNSGNYRLANNEGLNYSPEFMFVNGTSNLESHVGEFVEVFNSVNELIATLEIIEGGYLMTTALYGDDPQSDQVEGLQDGEYLTFKFNGDEINSDIAFKGNMELRELNLEFANGGAWSIYPNPLTTTTTINYEITSTSNVSIKVFDITGRQIDEVVNARQDASYYSATWDATYFEKGVYMLELHINGAKVTTERVVVQ